MGRLTTKQKLEKIKSDPFLWIKNFVKIVDNNGELIPFELHEQQLEVLNGLTKFNIISKSRQLGFTTFSLAYCLYMACTRPNTNYLIVSYKKESSSALFERLKIMYENLPHEKYPNYFPACRRDNRDELVLEFSNGQRSRIQCVVAGNKDVGRGNTFEYILLSEFAFYEKQEKLLLSCEQALAKNPNSKIVIESTSNGMNFFYKLVSSAAKGESKYKLFFFPFYAKAYNKLFAYDYKQAEEWFKAENHGQRLHEKDLEEDEKILFKNGATLKQLMWRRWKLLDMDESEFKQEYPSSWQESFITTGQNVFDQVKVIRQLELCINPLHKDEIKDCPKELLKYINKQLFIYHLPKRNKRYYAGIDVSSGSGGDYSTISMFDDEGEQVLSFYYNKIAVFDFADVIDCIGKFYNYAFLTVERNSYGKPLIERLRKEKRYMNMYKQKIFDQGKKRLQLGWMTTNTTKEILITDFKEQFEKGLININCKETLEQMQIFVENGGKMGNKKGERNHDDLVISSALAVQGMKARKWYV
ncbi:terminase family protein [Parageobacillus sp. G301]|uniref:terminase large subunit domain-containing protein n=1 Tax=Parageobacillus sp. G301 TaxID=2998290 RepID=UPI002495CF92|nr:terminase family protein [Parageobacillus sp. G301]GLH62394.1 terminase [Parageobacillus sp. G301]